MRNEISIKAEAKGLILGLGDKDWEEYLLDLIESTDAERLNLNWENAIYPLPKQLKNPTVAKEGQDGIREYQSSLIWLKLNKEGEKELLIPDETSGVLLEKETGKVIRGFIGLPMVTPKDTDFLIRILIRHEEEKDPKMNWMLYSNKFN